MGLVTGKVTLVTGGGSGIGRATALAFAREGATGVVVVDLDEQGAAGTVHDIEASGGHAFALGADVSDEDQVRRMVAAAVETYGRLDCAHNNAGTNLAPTPLVDLELADWSRLLSINLTSVFLCLRSEMAVMRAGGGGAIVNTASVSSFLGIARNAAYCASKHAVLGLTKTAAIEGAGDRIRVNAVCPGRVDTPLQRRGRIDSPEVWAQRMAEMPLGKIGEPEDIAESVVWLCSDRSGFITGESLVLDGGMYATRSR